MKVQQFTNVYKSDELSKIIYLNFLELRNQPNIDYSVDSIKKLLVSPDLIGWFLLDNNDVIVGYVVGKKAGTSDGRFIYYIEYFYVIPELRNKGYGKKMMLVCIKKMNELNIPHIMLTTKKIGIANALYQSLGFVVDPIVKINNNDYHILTYFMHAI